MYVGWNSVVGIEAHYRLDGPVIKSQCGVKIFRTHPDWPWGPPQPLVQWVPGSFLGVKSSGHGIDHPM